MSIIKEPFFSLLLPTRDRPEVVDLVLLSLTKQTFKNFEVILSDNYILHSCQDTYLKFNDRLNIKYIKPDKPITMAENYTLALSMITGKYIIALEDKYALIPFALQELHQTIEENNFEIINFQFDTYIPNDDNFEMGTWKPSYNIYPSEIFHPLDSLKQNIQFRTSYANQSIKTKIRNKILIGCWSRKLLDRINQHCQIFQPLSPDYTSMILGSIYSQSLSYDIGRSLGMVIKFDQYSGGNTAYYNYEYTKQFMKENDKDGNIKRYCPFNDCFFIFPVNLSIDYIRIINEQGFDKKLKINLKNLALRAREHLDIYLDLSKQDKDYLKSVIPKPSLWVWLLDRIYNYLHSHYNPFYILLYLKVNMLGKLGFKRYKSFLAHRNLCKSYNYNVKNFNEILDDAHKHYTQLFL